MTQEDKELLLKDLCARLPYGVKVEYNTIKCEVLSIDKYNEELTIRVCPGYTPIVKLENIKPYLLPLSSMTEEIMDEIYATTGVYDISIDSSVHIEAGTTFEDLTKIFDILHKHHIDYRGLIPMGLANDATGLNIY